MPATIRILIADDHRLFAEALEAILSTDERLEIVGKAADGEEAVGLAVALKPDVMLMDLAMPKFDGIEVARLIREKQPAAVILMLTGSNSNSDIDRSRVLGAAGYVTKDLIASELIEAIVGAAR